MKFESINSLILILAAVAVVVRLVLVIFKLRQNIEAAMSQLTHQGYQFSSQVGISTLGEDPAALLAKARGRLKPGA